MSNVTTGQILRYTLLPGILPRIIAFFASGFSYIAFYMAYVYKNVRLLPGDHPYLNPANAGKYGIRHVVFEARRNLEFKKENIDQIIIFFTLLIGIAILFLQFALLLGGLLIPSASAGAAAYYASFFVTQDPTYDLAFRMLDLTFGFGPPRPIFNSCAINAGVQCQLAFVPGVAAGVPVGPASIGPTQFHTALHALFEFYNIGILVIGFMIFMYMIVTIVGETAQSGTPFGKRFNGMWAPTRLVIAIALLTPLSYGLNGAQLLTLTVAKWGSSLATNGWQSFMTDLDYLPMPVTRVGELVAGPEELVARPDAPLVTTLIEFTFVAQTCKHSERLLNRRGIGGGPPIEAFQVFGEQSAPFVAGGFNAALANANNGDIVVRFGIVDDINFKRFTGHVKPICGEIIFHTKDIDQPGALRMQEGYYDIVFDMWTDPSNDFYAENIALRYMPVAEREPDAVMPNSNYIAAELDWFNQDIPDLIEEARDAQVAAEWRDNYTQLGWAGAAMWYQKVAEYTGGLFSSVYGIPTPHLYPEVMEHVKSQRRIQNDFVEGQGRFNPSLSNGNMIEFENERDKHPALAYYYAQQFWWGSLVQPSGNTFIDSIISIFGLTGLFEMQSNLDIHPLAQLIGIGRSLIESSVTNLGFSFGSGVVGGIANILGRDLVGSVAMAASSFAGQVALIGLSIGFILFYILPFLPFIYFFFAVGGWIKGIFEAMVGLPLWALAHIRIDGEGLPGPAAMNGYFLILEILLRPILIVFGMLAGIVIFAAQVQILNEVWQLVVSNVMGFDGSKEGLQAAADVTNTGLGVGVGAEVGSIDYLRNSADRLFHTIMYAIIVYMLAMSSFKLVDLIPNNVLRWVGASVSTFGEQSGDPAANLVRYTFMGSQMALGSVNSGLQGLTMRSS